MLIIGCDFHTRFQQIAMAEDSTGELLLERRTAAGDHQQARQHHAALVAGGSSAKSSAVRSRPAAGLLAVEVPSRTRGGQSGHRAQVGRAYVLDAA